MGTTGGDTFVALSNGTAATTNTLNAPDILDGGAGTDTLSITVTDDDTATLGGAQIKNIEVLNIRSATAAKTATLDADSATGETTINSNVSAGAVTVTNVASGTTVGIIGNGSITNGATTATYKTTATDATLALSGGTTGTGAVSVTAAGATNFTVTSSGAANTIGTLAAPGTSTGTLAVNASSNLTTGAITTLVKYITVAGTAPTTLTSTSFNSGVTLGAFTDANLTSIDASGLTAGGVTATLLAGITSLKGGSGNDVITEAALTSPSTSTIDAGAGTGDVLVIADATHVDTAAETAPYKNFEIIRNGGATDLDVSLFSGITGVQTSGADAGFTKLTAGQAADIRVLATNASNTFSLATSSGTNDSIGFTLQNALAKDAATVVSLTGATLTGFENLVVHANSGIKSAISTASPSADVVSFAAAADLKSITIDGGYDVKVDLANALNVRTLDVSATAGAAIALAANTAALTVTATSAADYITLGTPGVNGSVTINAGAGNDIIKGTLAQAAVVTVDAGASTTGDKLLLSDTALGTVNDNSFSGLTNFEKLELSSTDAYNLTSGGFFNQAFPTGVTITGATAADTKVAVIDLSTYTKAATVTLVSDDVDDAGAIVLKGGAGDDTLTVTAAAYTGAVAGIVINGGAGNDTIKFSDLNTGVAGSIVITGGAGADLIDHTSTGAASAHANVTYSVTGANDSTVAAYDQITHFAMSDGTAKSDKIDLSGTATLQATASATATGITNVTYAISSAGLLSFAGTGATDLTLAQKIDIANTVTTTDGAYVVFTDSGNSYVFHQDVTNGDQLVALIGVTATGGSVTSVVTSGYVYAV